jgi:hypothetical protein
LHIQQVELKSRETKLKSLDLKYNKLNTELDKLKADKNASDEQVKKLEEQRQQLEKEKRELSIQLQAKLEAKSKLAQASAQVVNTVTNTKTASASDTGSLHSIIAAAASRYGVSYDMMIRLATCESSMGTNLRNPSPVIVNGVNYGHAEGVYQFIPSTWTRMSNQAGYGGASVYDTVANVNTAAWAFANGNKNEWECKA